MASIKVLLVTTSHSKLGNTGHKTGVWLEELAAPYYVFIDAGASVTFASPKGGPVPLDPKSELPDATTISAERFLKDNEAVDQLSRSLPLSVIKAEDFDIVFLPGGHGPMWDLAANDTLKLLLEDFNRQGKPIGSVCHGVVGLVSVRNEKGEPLVKGRTITSFSNTEEELAGLTNVVPFLLESKLISLGAVYTKGPDFASHVVEDRNIITGQNPASSVEAARKMLALFIENKMELK